MNKSCTMMLSLILLGCVEPNRAVIDPTIVTEMVPVKPEADLLDPLPKPETCHAPYGRYYVSVDLKTETGCKDVWSKHSGSLRTFDQHDEHMACGWYDRHRTAEVYGDCVQEEAMHVYSDPQGWHGFTYVEITCGPNAVTPEEFDFELPSWCKVMYTITATWSPAPWEEQEQEIWHPSDAERETRAVVNIEGLDKTKVLLALWNASKEQGNSFLGNLSGEPLTAEEAEAEINRRSGNLDYVKGRVIKCNISDGTFNPWGFDRDLGEGAAARAIEGLRQSEG